MRLKTKVFFLKSSKRIAWLAIFSLFFVGTSYAQYFSFGKNRVQYNSFDWKYIQSEHFDVHYYGSLNYELADFTVRTLESSLRQFSEDYRHDIADRIKVIIYDSHNDFSQTNVVALPADAEGIGGVTDAYKNRITMPFSGNYTEFRSTLHHELSHAVFNDMFYGGSVQSIISNNIQLAFPLWFSEGLAEYESSGWDTNTDMWMRDMVINNYLPNLSQLNGYLAYRGGQSLWNFIAEEYGREKIGEILQIIQTQRSVQVGFQRALGFSIEQLSDRWRDFYRRRYLPEVAAREDINNFATLVSNWADQFAYNTSPAVSPQGDRIAMITDTRSGYFDVVVVSAITGEKLKTLVRGNDNVLFEELNILNPNLSWSPDGTRLTLSAKSKGADYLAIVDYATGRIRRIEFPSLDAIGSVAWSPDGTKIAFDGNTGPYQDIFVYDLETQEFLNVTGDVIPDYTPSWSDDSETIYFVSSRGDDVELNTYKESTRLLLSDDLYSTDIYQVELGSSRAVRLTRTPNWSESQPVTTRDGRLLFISDQNGIPNVYHFDLQNRTSRPLTDLQSGIMQISVSADGSRLVVNAINEGVLDIYMIRSPFQRAKETQLSPNQWATRRQSEPVTVRVPATLYAQQMYGSAGSASNVIRGLPVDSVQADPDSVAEAQQEAEQDTANNAIDVRNYVFAAEVEQDTSFVNRYLNANLFNPEGNTTNDGRYQPREYRLQFTTDIVYAGGGFSTNYGYGITQVVFSDLLGDHQIVFGSNLVFDLRNSNYYLSYGYLKERTNWLFNFSHFSSSFQTFGGQLYRFRTLSGGIAAQYPLDRFRRLDFGINLLSLNRDFAFVGFSDPDNQNSTFLYPRATYTVDRSVPGFITPVGGHRYSVGLSGSPPLISDNLEFVTLMGDFRKYVNMGYGYSIGLRGSGAISYGRDSQTFFMGGMQGWINQRWQGNSIPSDRISDTFFTLPALPLRGHRLNTIYGDHFALINAEFRFPLFAAILPGPIPILPLYNMTGVAFIDAGTAWGQDIPFELRARDPNDPFIINDSELNFKVSEEVEYFYNVSTGDVQAGSPPAGEPSQIGSFGAVDGDVLIGAGFGLRTIVLGLPVRYDVGWPYYRDGFASKPIHYFSIGIDF